MTSGIFSSHVVTKMAISSRFLSARVYEIRPRKRCTSVLLDVSLLALSNAFLIVRTVSSRYGSIYKKLLSYNDLYAHT